jgi:hypothetical protein
VKRLVAAVGCAATLLASGATLRAAPDAHEEEARVHFDRGLLRLDAREYERALDEFRRAYDLWQNPRILLNIGTVLRELGRDAAAANAYARFVRDPSADPARLAEANRLLAELDRHLARLAVRAPADFVSVFVDGQPLAPWEDAALVRVAPGTHQVTGERPGSAPVTSTLRVAAQEAAVVELRIERAESAPRVTSAAIDAAGQAGTDARDRTPAPATRASHAGQFGAFVRADVDGRGRGVVVAPGASLGVGDHVEIMASALVGRDKGAWLGGRAFLLRSELKPALRIGVPVFFVDGARVGVHAALGLVFDPSRNIALSLDAGVAHFFSVPVGYDATVFVPSLELQVRL